MLRFEVSEHPTGVSSGQGVAGASPGDRSIALGQAHGALPPIDLADDVVVIGSGEVARVRLPAEVARAVHVRIEGQTWTLLAEAKLGGLVRAAGDSGAIGRGMLLEIGKYRVRVCAAPVGTVPTPPQRTESLARELVRSLLGEGAAPSLEIERGTNAGARRTLPPPEATLVIGRGDEATWVILDEDLSRTHVELRRGWDGVTVVDLGSKNGTRVDGVKVAGAPVELHDGAALALGDIVLRFRDPAERHLCGEPDVAKLSRARAASAQHATPRVPSRWPALGFAAIAVLAVATLIWILAT
jgi:type III secretion system (T3SS) inner membrane Yop/YscD-like protein